MQIACACGCNRIIINPDSQGRYRKFIHGHHSRGRSRDRHPSWKGGRFKHLSGYILVLCPDHSRAKRSKGYVFEHVLVMEKYLGRYLTKDEVVHHINEIKHDNRIENLKLMRRSDHIRWHCRGKHIDTSNRLCFSCGSNTTLIVHPKGKWDNTPYPLWKHLPNDKINWYCNKCYARHKRLLSSKSTA